MHLHRSSLPVVVKMLVFSLVFASFVPARVLPSCVRRSMASGYWRLLSQAFIGYRWHRSLLYSSLSRAICLCESVSPLIFPPYPSIVLFSSVPFPLLPIPSPLFASPSLRFRVFSGKLATLTREGRYVGMTWWGKDKWASRDDFDMIHASGMCRSVKV